MSGSAGGAEFETVRAFSTSAKRARVAEMFSNRKRRAKFVESLAHFTDFDARYVVAIPAGSKNADGIEAMLKERGAPEACHVMSEWSAWDGAELPLGVALKQIVGKGMGTIVCCIPGRLAFFENEDGRYILEHPLNTPKNKEPKQ